VNSRFRCVFKCRLNASTFLCIRNVLKYRLNARVQSVLKCRVNTHMQRLLKCCVNARMQSVLNVV
jgi:hypothetical protein